MERLRKILDTLFRDSSGKIVIAQFPNAPLIGWIVCMMLSQVSVLSNYQSGFEMMSFGFLFVWAYLEFTAGVNVFRRIVGGVVMVGMGAAALI